MTLTCNSLSRTHPLTIALLVLPLFVWPEHGVSQVSEINPAPAFSGERLADTPRVDWITNGGNVYNQRYSPLDEINQSYGVHG
jgi:glucose dehydrogenase